MTSLKRSQARRRTVALWLTTLLLMVATALLAQVPGGRGENLMSFSSAGQASPSPAATTLTVSRHGKVLERRVIDPEEVVSVIVELAAPPLARIAEAQRSASGESKGILAQAGMRQGLSAIEREQSQLQSDILRFEAERATSPAYTRLQKPSATQILHQNKSCLNAAALRTPRWMLERLSSLPYIHRITLDRTLTPLDIPTNHAIGADSLSSHFGLSGQGVRIGIIDSGIDYLHPDFGGGYGPGFRVAGGYDFVNHDTDPMDDFGHGTVVAGIIAGDGPLVKGVAPSATLYAYKVVSYLGYASYSDVIAALEMAVDPDGNPATDDHLDVVNISLGAKGGDPDDALCQAVDNTSKAGVLVVAAAGNSYEPYFTVTTPSIAREAISVGGSDHNLVPTIAARGPAPGTFALKPDLQAPGSSVTSTARGGGYTVMDGTSLAAAATSGGAALLKQLHPGWTPRMLKDVLMASAKDWGAELLIQGTGGLDLWKATQLPAIPEPASLSFGLCDLSQSLWVKAETLKVQNVSTTPLQYDVSLEETLPAGITVTFSPSSLSLPPKGSGSFTVTLQVDKSFARVPATESQAVEGRIRLWNPQDTSGSFKVPFLAMLGAYLEMAVTGGPSYSYITRLKDTTSEIYSFWEEGGPLQQTYTMRRMMAPGDYDVITLFGMNLETPPWVVLDSAHVDPVAHVTVNRSQAVYQVGTQPVDELGQILDPSTWMRSQTRLSSERTGVAISVGHSQAPLSRYNVINQVCPLSNRYSFEYFLSSYEGGPKFFSYRGQYRGLNAHHVLTPQAGDFRHRSVRYSMGTLTDPLAIILWPILSGFSYWATGGGGNDCTLETPYLQDWYMTGDSVSWTPVADGYYANYREVLYYPLVAENYHQLGRLMFVPTVQLASDGTTRLTFLDNRAPALEVGSRPLVFGLGPWHLYAEMDNEPTHFRLKTPTPAGVSFIWYGGGVWDTLRTLPFFLGQLQDHGNDASLFQIRDMTGGGEGRVMFGGWVRQFVTGEYLPSGELSWSSQFPLPAAGHYRTQVFDTHSRVVHRLGTSHAWLDFDTRRADPNPPAMTTLTITADSNFTDVVLPGQTGEVAFQLLDRASGLGPVTLGYHTESDTLWQDLALSRRALNDAYRQERFTATLPSVLPNEFVSLKITAADLAGNTLEFTAEPAFRFGPNRPPVVTGPVADTLAHEDTLYRPRLPVLDPDCDPLRWQILSGPAWLAVDTVRGGISGTPRAADLGTSQVRLLAQDPDGAQVPVAFSLYVLHTNHAPSRVRLLEPASGDTLLLTNPPRPVVFRWQKALDVDAGDTLRYQLTVKGAGLDTTVAGLADTVLTLMVMNQLHPDSVYSTVVGGSDGVATTYSDTVRWRASSIVVGITDARNTLPKAFALRQNYPNPFNPTTTIRYELPQTAKVSLRVYNVLGQVVRTLVEGEEPPGRYAVDLQAQDLASGIYFYRIQAGNFTQTRAMCLVR